MKLFGKLPYPAENKNEVNQMIDELIRIGKTDGYLSERSGHPFDGHCRHIRTREIGKRLNDIGGFDLMDFIYKRISKKLNLNLASHLEYAWKEIGDWLP
ncbi:MAG: hypothetical protein JEZ06_10085 [Anaerolineaceae bacterium]|nr:hypothetical protein [Anaerolineaceae bacterium]